MHDIDQALKDWAHWLSCGRRGDGFPRCNVLHQSWLPPTPGSTPTMKVSTFNHEQFRRLHDAIGRLSVRLANTVVVHYCYRLSEAEQCERLKCARATLHHRLATARQQLQHTVWRSARGTSTN